MFSSWDLVRPRFWHPMAAFEQSMMDLDMMANRMSFARFPFEADVLMLSPPHHNEDDDFFADLPLRGHRPRPEPHQPVELQSPKPKQQSEQPQPAQQQPEQPQQQQQQPEQQPSEAQGQTPSPAQTVPARTFSSYSYSSSSFVDDKGQQVTSTRRRYEDSTGRLKAMHERQIQDRKIRTLWNRKDQQDQGTQEVTCTNVTADEFEKMWKETAFGVEEEEKKTKVIKGQAEATEQLSNTADDKKQE